MLPSTGPLLYDTATRHGDAPPRHQWQSHKVSAHRLHEAGEPAPLGWFPMPHNHPAEWILMHRP